MKTIQNIAAQGDLIVRRVRVLPKDVVDQKVQGDIIVAHSETGHHHVAQVSSGGAVALMARPNDQLRSYLRVDSGSYVDFVHQRPFDTHETLRMLCNPGDVLEIRRQREWTPEGWRRVED